MNHRIITTALFSVLLLATNALAHEGQMHKGKPVEGTATAITATSLTVKGDTGESAVTLTPETKFEAGEEGKPATKSDLREGSFVMVYGTKLETGELVAKEIMIHSSAKHADQEHHEASHSTSH